MTNSTYVLTQQAKINHQHNQLSFDTHIDLSHEDPDYGTQIQCMVSTRLRNQIINMSSALQKIVAITSADKIKVFVVHTLLHISVIGS